MLPEWDYDFSDYEKIHYFMLDNKHELNTFEYVTLLFCLKQILLIMKFELFDKTRYVKKEDEFHY